MTEPLTRSDLTVLIATVLKENRRKSKVAQCAIFLNTIKSGGYEDYLDAALEMVFNMLHRRAQVTIDPPSAAELAQRAQARRDARLCEDRSVAVLRAMLTGQALLDLITPNGKLARDCSGRECMDLGGFWWHVGRRIGPAALVGEALSADELEQIARANLLTEVGRTRPGAAPEQRPDA